MNALLLAAGLGTRFLPYTKTIPKPAIPLMNVPIAFYNLHLLQQLGVDALTVNTHHLPSEIEKLFTDTQLIDVKPSFSVEKEIILGTGGAIKHARLHLEGRGTFVVANADVVNGFGIADALEFHQSQSVKPLATLVVINHPDCGDGKKYGAIWVDGQNCVVDISKKRPAGREDLRPLHFVGVHFIEESVFKYIPEGPCSITEGVYLEAIKQGETILIYEKSGLWFDAGSLKDYFEATVGIFEILPKIQLFRRFWQRFDHRPNLWEGEHCEHLLSLGSNSQILMGNNCNIHPSVKVQGFAVFGDGVVIEQNAQIENTVIASGVRIVSGMKYKNSLILK
jgi:NDP-sugar pyrophosphorylase family protein